MKLALHGLLVARLLSCFALSACSFLSPRRASIRIGTPAFAFATCAGERTIAAPSASGDYGAAVKFVGEQLQNDQTFVFSPGPHSYFTSDSKSKAYQRAQVELSCVSTEALSFKFLLNAPSLDDPADATQLLSAIASLRDHVSTTTDRCSDNSLTLDQAVRTTRLVATRARMLLDLILRLNREAQDAAVNIVKSTCAIQVKAESDFVNGSEHTVLTYSPSRSTLSLYPETIAAPSARSYGTKTGMREELIVPSTSRSGEPAVRKRTGSVSCVSSIAELTAATNDVVAEIETIGVRLPAHHEWRPTMFDDCLTIVPAPPLQPLTFVPSNLVRLVLDESAVGMIAGGVAPYYTYGVDPGLNVEAIVDTGRASGAALRMTITDAEQVHRLLLSDYIGEDLVVSVKTVK